MSKGAERRVLAMADASRVAFRPLFNDNCCVIATRVGLHVLAQWGLKARPVLAIAGAFNREAAAGGQEPPAAYVRTCNPHDPTKPEGLAGHVVIVGKVGSKKFLLDLSAYQMDRPQKRIHVPTGIAMLLTTPLVADWTVSAPLAGEGFVAYARHPHPELVPWERSAGWTLPTPAHRRNFDQAVVNLVARVRDLTGSAWA